jgi:hypothetical protein
MGLRYPDSTYAANVPADMSNLANDVASNAAGYVVSASTSAPNTVYDGLIWHQSDTNLTFFSYSGIWYSVGLKPHLTAYIASGSYTLVSTISGDSNGAVGNTVAFDTITANGNGLTLSSNSISIPSNGIYRVSGTLTAGANVAGAYNMGAAINGKLGTGGTLTNIAYGPRISTGGTSATGGAVTLGANMGVSFSAVISVIGASSATPYLVSIGFRSNVPSTTTTGNKPTISNSNTSADNYVSVELVSFS